MSGLIEIDWKPDDATLRSFGFIALVGFGVLAGLAWTEKLVFSAGLGEARPFVAGGLLALGVLSTLLSLVWPRANWPLYAGLTLIALPIGFVLSYVIMGILFFGLITPVGIVFRLLGRDPLNRGFDPEASTYWADARPARDRESYFRQF